VDDLTQAERQAEREERLRHGSSFGAAAAAYAKYRPDYAVAAVRWALEPVSTREPLRVLDLGAGTGVLYRPVGAPAAVAALPDRGRPIDQEGDAPVPESEQMADRDLAAAPVVDRDRR
jgi:hypothetical protein